MQMITRIFPIPRIKTMLGWKILVFLLGLALIVFREPKIITSPQLWAEEGARYFKVAYYFANTPEWYEGLLQLQNGYFSLWPNLAATIAANLLPIEYAPFATTFLALLVFVILFYSILWLASGLWKSAYIKTLCILMLILVPNTWEVWLNTINSQFMFSVVAFILLNAELDKYKIRRYFSYITLVLCGLTGIVSVLLTPLFIFKAYHERKGYQIIQAVIISVCAILQGIIILTGLMNNQASLTTRWDLPGIPSVSSIIMTQNIGYLLGGLDNMSHLFFYLDSLKSSSVFNYGIISTIFILVEILFLMLITFYLKIDNRIICLGAYLLIFLVSISGSLAMDKFYLSNPHIFLRYFYAPNAIIILTLLANLQANHPPFRRPGDKVLFFLSIGIVLISLFWGISQFRKTTPYGSDWPIWKTQIQIWREDPSYQIEIWPKGWKTELRKPGSD